MYMCVKKNGKWKTTSENYWGSPSEPGPVSLMFSLPFRSGVLKILWIND